MSKKDKDRRLKDAIKDELKTIYIVIFSVLGVMLALIFLYIFLRKDYWFYILVGLAVALSAFIIVMLYRLPKVTSDLVSSGLTSDLMRAVNSFTVQKEPVYMAETGIIEFDDLKERFADVINSLRDVVVVDRDVDDSYLKFGFEAGYEGLISRDSFIYNLPFILKLNSSSRGGLVLVRINGQVNPPQEAVSELLKTIRKTFSTKVYIGRYSEDTLIIYVTDVESLSTFRTLCLRLYASFSYLENDLSSSKILTCVIGASVYPYSLKDSLVIDAQEALEKSKDVNIFLPKYLKPLKGGIESKDDIRRRNLITVENLVGLLFRFKGSTEDTLKLDDTVLPMAESIGFQTVGLISRSAFSVEGDLMSCLKEIGNPSLHLFNGRADISLEELKPLYEARDENDCFYSTRREDLSPEIAKFFDKYGLSAFYCSFFHTNGALAGMSYYAAKDKIDYLSSADSYVIVMEMIMLDYISMNMVSSYHTKLVSGDFEAIMKLDGKMRYIVNPSSFVLQGISEGLSDVLNGKGKGEKCYKALFNLDKPCAECPFLSEKGADNPIVLAGKKYLRRKLSYNNPDNISSVLLTPYDPEQKEKSEGRFDEETLLSSRSSFNSEIANLVQAKAKGSLLLIALEGVNTIVSKYGEADLADLVIDMKKRIYDLGFGDEKIYRYDDGILAMYFPEVSRIQLYDVIEKIHAALTNEYTLEGQLIKCHFRYTEVTFNGAFNLAPEAFTLISRGLVQAKKLGDDYMCIANEPISRVASKIDYVLYLMEANFLNKAVEFKIQPITSAKDGSVRFGEILLRLYDVLREQQLNPLEVVSIASDAKKMGKFDSLNYETAIGLYNKYGSGIFRIYSFGGVSINISSDSLESNDWLSKVKNYLENNMVPEHFLGLEIPEHDFVSEIGRIKVWVNELRSYHLSWAVDNYADEHISPRELSELGFDTVKLSRKFLLDAVADPVNKGLFQSVIRESHYNGLKVVVQGVETKEQYEFAKKAGADFIQGFYLYSPLSIDEFMTAVQEHPDLQKIQADRKETPENKDSSKPKKKPNLFDRLKEEHQKRQLLRAKARSDAQMAVVSASQKKPDATEAKDVEEQQ
jgi:EAL domain-containing protein (putative c-di-GMP-specific phosphodiesterase class I)/GGDEF domain-containing protein